MAEAQGMPEFVNRGLHGTFHEFVFAIASELGKGDDRPSTSNIRMAKDQPNPNPGATGPPFRIPMNATPSEGLPAPSKVPRPVPFRHGPEGPSGKCFTLAMP